MSLFLSKQEEKPLTTCQKCKTQPCIKTGKICDKVERLLSRAGIHGADWIRPKMPSHKREKGEWREIPFSMLNPKNIDLDKSIVINNL